MTGARGERHGDGQRRGALLATGREDIVRLRKSVRERAIAAGFNLVEQTKIITAASELGRNTHPVRRGGEARSSGH
jgi:anti-sigma regulatory factor (Ser/Thr protein kinase)